MVQPRYKVTWKTFAFTLIGIAVFVGYIYIFQVDIQEIIATAENIRLDYYVLAATAAIFDTFFFALAWHSLLRFLKVKISMFRSFMYTWIGIFVDSVIPAESVSGEISKIFLVNRDQYGTAGEATASVVAQRVIGMAINVGTLLVGAFLLLTQRPLQPFILDLTLFIIAITFVFLFLIIWLSRRPDLTLRLVDAVIRFGEWITRGHWKLEKLREEAIESAKSFHVAMNDYSHAPRPLFLATSLSVISWGLALAVFYLTFRAIGFVSVSWSVIIVTFAIFTAVKSIPVGIPFEVGLPEITLSTLLIILGVPYDISFTVTIMMRLLTFWMKFAIGFGAQQWLGVSVFAGDSQEKTPLIDGRKNLNPSVSNVEQEP